MDLHGPYRCLVGLHKHSWFWKMTHYVCSIYFKLSVLQSLASTVLSMHHPYVFPVLVRQDIYLAPGLSTIPVGAIENNGLTGTKRIRGCVLALANWPRKNKVCINAWRLIPAIPNAQIRCLHDLQYFSRSPVPKCGWPAYERSSQTHRGVANAPW